MFSVLSTPSLYRYIPQLPPTLEQIQSRFKKWEARISPDQSELWLNWIAREKSSGLAIGHFQAGVNLSHIADIGYVVGENFQRKGFAMEVLSFLKTWLSETLGVLKLRAAIDTRNVGSIALMKKLGCTQSEIIKGASEFPNGSLGDDAIFELDQ